MPNDDDFDYVDAPYNDGPEYRNPLPERQETGVVYPLPRPEGNGSQTDFIEALSSFPLCELVGGPLDGSRFRWPDSQREAVFGWSDNKDWELVYMREPESCLFLYRGTREVGE